MIYRNAKGRCGEMSTFAEQVYAIVADIPAGKVVSYGQIARILGRPHGARQVGYAMAAAGDQNLPCHRVLRADGSLAPDEAFGGGGFQRTLLLREGVSFLPDGRVDMRTSGWL